MQHSRLWRRLAPALGLSAFACATVPKESSLSKALNSKASETEMRATTNALAINVPGEVETSCNEIMAKTTDPIVRRRALRFKIEVVPAYYMALFESDALAAAIDIWVLSLQLERYLSDGPGRDLFGAQQSIAVEAARRNRERISAAVKSVAMHPENYDRGRTRIETWAHENPIGETISSRPSVLPLLAQIAGSPDSSVWGAFGDVTSTIGDISTRLDVYAGYLPKAGRWQAELLVDEVADRDDSHLTLSTFASLKKTSDRVDELVTPEAIHEATGFAIAAFRTERIAAVAAIDKMRIDTIRFMTEQGQQALAAVDLQRQNVVADIDRQRALALKQVDDLRKQTFADLDGLVTRIIVRSALAVALLLLFAAGLAYLVVRAGTRAGRSSPD